MRQIITVSFDNAIFQLDEEAHGALRRYLDRAKAGLAGNPDVNEILGDIERSISEKCAGLVKAGKAILQRDDIRTILDEMGPVAEDPVVDQSEARSEPVAEPPIPRRLYKQREGAKLSGVCSGLAQYFSIDVVFVRAAFIGLTLLGFVGVLAYLILELLMPVREPQGAGSFKVLTLVIFAAALGIFLWTMKDYPGMGMLRIPELLMIPMVILMYGIPFVIVVAGVLLALVAANYLRSGPRW